MVLTRKAISFLGLFILSFVSCKDENSDVSFVAFDHAVEYYRDGPIRSVGIYNPDLLPDFHGKFGRWNEYHINGKLKETGQYKSGLYVQCCFAGPCEQVYNYKIGKWKYYYNNGQLRAVGTYDLSIKEIATSCAGSEKIHYSHPKDDWLFYNKDGQKLETSEVLLNQIKNHNPFYILE
ncbi:hypothetical protein [uncultured Psychroserpens sp.]|uniref:toxin-antitoxin system YwqK family antitoxin n=1 Tax=uncultured Psychroserpens sp. TaxID=255436 RepID=UPI0026169838|nr:hypothetical protein [uncultured Psychroserpens sp.]